MYIGINAQKVAGCLPGQCLDIITRAPAGANKETIANEKLEALALVVTLNF